MKNICLWTLLVATVTGSSGCYWRPGYYLHGGQYGYAPYQTAPPALPAQYAQPVQQMPVQVAAPQMQPVMLQQQPCCQPCVCQ